MVLTGLIRDIFPQESYGDSNRPFIKRVLWLNEIGSTQKVPNTWAIEFWGDDASRLDNFDRGMKVNINFEVRGKLSERNGEEKVFNTIRGIKIQRLT